MVECLNDFPFRKIRFSKYLTLEVMMYVEHPDIYKFMFTLNKKTRSFIQSYFITIRNGFNNEGLITYYLQNDFFHY